MNRTLNRGGRLPASRYLSAFSVRFDWRRALTLHRRLLSGDLGVLRDVSLTPTDTVPALVVMLVGVLAASLGSWLWLTLETGDIGGSALRVLLFGSLAAAAAWGIGVAVTWYALRSMFALEVDRDQLLRALALAAGFAVWQFCMIAGPASFAIGLVATVAGLMLSIIAVRAAVTEADDRAAVISVGCGFGASALLLSLLADLTGVGSGLFVHAIGQVGG